MAHLVFEAEQRELREAARAEFPGNPALACVLENLAAEGIDLNGCRVPAERGLPERSSEASEVA
ncbi:MULTISPECIES: hypothetical protein [Streptomyces]|uniref:Uncharacterized protein n=1 Tax=Streptomyces venezuelae TaxID=54571 RepID=A0A5P2B199_STRVZ|nr:hypothetical protein [Streptomyces venezuelae]QES24274.1 hypothetical protein DEJ46_38595 [Streptomyces venezuelae]